jgi:hypothetical protein
MIMIMDTGITTTITIITMIIIITTTATTTITTVTITNMISAMCGSVRWTRRKLGVLPPPLRGRVGEGGSNKLRCSWSPPSLSLPRKGGGDHGVRAIAVGRPQELLQ